MIPFTDYYNRKCEEYKLNYDTKKMKEKEENDKKFGVIDIRLLIYFVSSGISIILISHYFHFSEVIERIFKSVLESSLMVLFILSVFLCVSSLYWYFF